MMDRFIERLDEANDKRVIKMAIEASRTDNTVMAGIIGTAEAPAYNFSTPEELANSAGPEVQAYNPEAKPVSDG